jgi:hypothetical protein
MTYGDCEFPELDHLVYLTGVSTPATREAGRDDLGLLVTPASSVHRQIGHYGLWAADNGCFAETEARPFDPAAWLAWLEQLPTAGCLFAVLPDVVGDPVATMARTRPFLDQVRALGFPVAIVAQDGLESMPELLEEVLAEADVVFIGGSTDWKLGEGARYVIAQARERGLWVHVGRVNSLKRLRFALETGADSADGTYLAYGPSVNFPKLCGWLDALDGEVRPGLESLALVPNPYPMGDTTMSTTDPFDGLPPAGPDVTATGFGRPERRPAPQPGDLEPLERPGGCTLCRCAATALLFGFRVCDYHQAHGEGDAPCPVCYPGEVSTTAEPEGITWVNLP